MRNNSFKTITTVEIKKWILGRKILINLIIWSLLGNGILLVMLLSGEKLPSEIYNQETLSQMFLLGYLVFSGIGLMLIMQNSLLNELTQGTTAWILSKPVKRSTYLTAKLFGNLIPSILIISCLQGVIGVISIKLHFNGLDVATLPLIISISFANNLFYLTYSVMVSIISRSNLISIGLIFMLIFGQQMLIGVFPLLADFLPFSQTYLATAVLLSSQSPIATFTPLFLVIEAVIFMIFAIWRFNHYEF